MTTTPFLAADCVARSFAERRVLAAASLRAVPGEVRVLLGVNGCGKTTLMRITVGLMQPDAGIVMVHGTGRLRVSLAGLAREGVFYLPDHGILRPELTVGEHFEALRDLPHLEGLDEFEALLDRMRDAYPLDLSPGETKRAELTLALARRPRCLLADEPFREVAPKDAEWFGEALRRLAAAGCAVVLSGHEVPTLMHVADHITWCTAGTTQEMGPPSEAARHDQFRREYLGPKAFI